jgi:hypothetical protein
MVKTASKSGTKAPRTQAKTKPFFLEGFARAIKEPARAWVRSSMEKILHEPRFEGWRWTISPARLFEGVKRGFVGEDLGLLNQTLNAIS